MANVQLNLLPDVKAQYIKSERTRRLVILICTIVIAISIGVIVVFYVLLGAQTALLNNAKDDIAKNSKTLKNVKDVEKMLTVQSQLNSLGKLHSDKVINSRLFGYLGQLLPANAQISDITLNFDDNTATITGTTDSLESNNKLVDTLKYAQYTTTDNQTPTPAFTNVTLASFARTDKGASYSITFKFDPKLFSTDAKGIQLRVKEGVTTREQNPNALFNKPAEVKK